MSHPNPAGNGCSLEDCYTNLFALTDICGIKWRRLATNPDSHVPLGLDHLEDPVLVSYSKCIQSDILCVWRRIQNQAGEQRTDHLSFNKELWIFWYGDEPAALESHVSKDLIVKETGSWDKGKDHGLSYECRTLLFKALHNLIERCLLTKGFARLGRWFVQPYDTQTQNTDRQTHLSFSFNFFLHGESSVCASIEVKQHPPVWRLTPHHLTLAQENHTNFQVILAPYGLNGTLTGQSYRDADQHAHKVLEEWSRFYPIDKSDKEGDSSKAPALVEVLVAGVRMKYPSSFVLLCDVEEYLHKNITAPAPATNLPRPQPVVPHSHLTPPSSPADISILTDHGTKTGVGVMASGGTHHMDISSDLIAKSECVFSSKIQEKMLQDNCINSVVSKRPSEAVSEETAAGVWDFNDPTTKLNCNCSRHRLLKNKPILTGQNKTQQGTTNKHGKGDFKTDKNERPPSRLGRSTAFHRQSTTAEVVDVDLLMQRATVQGVNFAPAQGPGGTLPQLNNTGEGSTVPEGHSPAAVPSPLEEPNSHSHVSQSGEPTMPKLSPHPPPEVPETKPVVENNPSAMVNGHVDFAKPNDVSTPKAAENVMSPPWVPSEAKSVSINNWIKSHQLHKHVEVPGIKRPLLPTLQTDGDSFVTENLYNLDPLNTWLSIPVLKKPRYEELSPDGESMMISQKHMNCNSPQSMEDDPYEFSDEASINPATITNRKMRDSRDEGFHNRKSPYGRGDDESGRLDSNRDGTDPGSLTSPPATPNPALKQDGLMHLNDLVVKPSDLDHIFESDSDNDDSSLLPKDTIIPDDLKHATKIVIQPTEGVIAASELIRMYPTPPSNNSESPISYHEVIETYERPIIKKEINVPSIEEFLKDVPSVFQPQEQEEFVSSEKYSTVTLPSNKLSPIHHPPDYKASWQFPMPIMEKPPPNSYINIPSIENISSLPSRMPSSAIESSPAMFQTSSVGPQRTPMSYELQSPASNASSYLNKTLNSVDNQGTNNQIAEVQSLIVNILLMDSRLNVFKDANFDSCNFCVCNGNIKGADSGILIEDPSGEAQYSCTCGFSAIRNRRFGIHAGLFYEDEVDITGVRNDRLDRRKPGLLSLEFNGEHKGDDPNMLVLELLLGQFTVPYPSSSSSQLLIRLSMNTDTSYAAISVDDFPLRDGNDVSYTALDQGRQAMEHCLPTKLNDDVMKTTCLHKWQFLQGATKIPLNSQDSQHLLKSLQPILQDAIQNKRVTRLWEQTFKLTGPLTWKEFHQLAGRGSEENSSPQPIPALLVGHDKDWLSVSPYSLRFWEKQFMEPYGKQRDIAYVVLAPDNNYVIDYVKIFFQELSNVYELCRLGRHAPFAKKLRDGIMRIGKKQAASKTGDEVEEEFFKQIGESPITNKLRLYAQVCSSWLAPLLGQQTLDQSVFEPNTNYRAGYKPCEPIPPTNTEHVFTVPPPTTVNEDNKENTQTSESNNLRDQSLHENDREKPTESPALVVYIVDPFSYGQNCEGESDMDRIIKIGLLKCYLQLVKSLPDNLQQNINLQIIPLHTVLESTERGSNMQQLKAISFSVFTACRWISSHNVLGRSLTGFGPASAADLFLKKKEDKKMKLYSPPFVIAPTKDKQALLAECHGEKLERSNVLYFSYCLSEDQRWLLAACTDEQGELMETATINIEIPNRNRRKKASARKIGLRKLWDFILGVVTMTTIPSRLVIGRFGRMGHGELKGWSGLLSKKNIVKSMRRIKDLCPNVCSHLTNSSEIPGILSVCLISLESHSSFQVLADAVKAEEKMSSNCPLQTPQDASCTHILVFPISANAQANSQSVMPDTGVSLGLGNIEDVMDDDNILSGLHEDFKMDNDINDGFLFNVFEEITNSPNTVLPGGNNSNPGSPTDNGRNSLSAMNGSTSNSQDLDPQDEQPNLLQQPLAMGYIVSTADSGPLPKWFYSACPESEHHKPYTFKAALHIQSNQEEFMPSSQRNSHPLDSSITCDVLRYVLENYNALSWLTFDPVKNDRQSSLPIHIVVLMQMYHALNAFL